MKIGGYYINLSGSSIPVYDSLGTTQIGAISNNECFIYGVPGSSTGWEGFGFPVTFLDASHNMVSGGIANIPSNIGDFTKYASNGSSWASTSTMVRKVNVASSLYNPNGSLIGSIPAGSYVSLDPENVCGVSNNDYISIKSYTINGTTTSLGTSNAFIDLVPNSNNWISVHNIILRKA